MCYNVSMHLKFRGQIEMFRKYPQKLMSNFIIKTQLSVLHVLLGHLYVFFPEMSVQIFCPFFWLGCLFVCLFLMIASSCLYILEINPCSVASLEDTFYHSVGYLFVVVVVVFFAVQKFLSLIISHLFIFVYIFFRRQIKKDLAVIYVKKCSACVFL